MVSDILSDAAQEIRDWLEMPDSPYEGASDNQLALIGLALEAMDRARVALDAPPAQEGEKC